MQTRRAASMEEKLRVTLKELESAKKLCDDLLRERDESEVEVKKIIDKNTSLKNELSELHISHREIFEEHQNLRQIVLEFQQCMGTHEQALNRITELELELSEALRTITKLESIKVQERAAKTCSLFNELVDGSSALVNNRKTLTIDLTGEDSSTEYPLFSSHNKIKKYIKLNKIIKKYKKCLHQQQIHRKSNNIRIRYVNLANQLNDLNDELIQSRYNYDQETVLLHEQLQARENTPRDIFSKYQASQQELNERKVEAGELADLVGYNAERYESLTNNLRCICSCSSPPANTQSVEPLPLLADPVLETVKTKCLDSVNNMSTNIFSDKVGQGLSNMISSFSQQSVFNTCLPGASFSRLINQIIRSKLFRFYWHFTIW